METILRGIGDVNANGAGRTQTEARSISPEAEARGAYPRAEAQCKATFREADEAEVLEEGALELQQSRPAPLLTMAQGVVGLVVGMLAIAVPGIVYQSNEHTRLVGLESENTRMKEDYKSLRLDMTAMSLKIDTLIAPINGLAVDMATVKTNLGWVSDYYHKEQRKP